MQHPSLPAPHASSISWTVCVVCAASRAKSLSACTVSMLHELKFMMCYAGSIEMIVVIDVVDRRCSLAAGSSRRKVDL